MTTASGRPVWVRGVHRVGVALLAVFVGAVTAVGLVGIAASWDGWSGLWTSFAVPETAIGVSWAVVGLFLAARRPTNPISWIILLVGLDALTARSQTAVDEIGSVPDGVRALVAVAAAFPMPPFPMLPALGLVLFPDGRPPGRRWWWLLGPVVALGVVTAAGQRIRPDSSLFGDELWDVASLAGALLLIVGIAALFHRRRSGDLVLRAQARGVLLTMAVAVGTMIVFFVLQRPWLGNTALALVPVSIGAAIVRYRLYDIDRVVSRVAAYTIIVAVLAGCYLASVLALGALARALTGESGDLVVALSTLAVAALFQPVRARAQTVVDRRFNRSRYDAVRTIDAFGRRLRDEVSREAVVDGLRAIVAGTFGVATVGLVLPEDESR